MIQNENHGCTNQRNQERSSHGNKRGFSRIEQFALTDSVANANGCGHPECHGGHKQHAIDVHRDVVGSDDLRSKPAE